MRSLLLTILLLVGCSSSPTIHTIKDPVVESRKVASYDVSEFTKPLDLSKYRDIQFRTKQDGDIYVVFLEYNDAVMLIELLDTLKKEVDTRTDVILELKKYYEFGHTTRHPSEDIRKTP